MIQAAFNPNIYTSTLSFKKKLYFLFQFILFNKFMNNYPNHTYVKPERSSFPALFRLLIISLQSLKLMHHHRYINPLESFEQKFLHIQILQYLHV